MHLSWRHMDAATPLVTVTDTAREKVLGVRASETNPDTLALWLEVSGEAAGAYTYDMYFKPLDEAADDDVVQSHDDLSLVIVADSADKVHGATLDFIGSGMVMQNPNRPSASPAVGVSRPQGDLSGPVAQRVSQVLEEQINPAIAAHGGMAELVAVEDSIAYLRLGGGCQGCGMAAVTLGQGIEVAILESVPEITEVIDVTDHASGDNPYFESAKK